MATDRRTMLSDALNDWLDDPHDHEAWERYQRALRLTARVVAWLRQNRTWRNTRPPAAESAR